MSAAARPGRHRVAGIDEAGLGPLLGPLTIGYAVLELPSPDLDPWQALGAVVSRKARSDRRRLPVADSKELFTRNPRGERRLELAALVFDALGRPGGRPPASASELVFGPLAPDAAEVARHPWYERLGALPFPRSVEAGTVELWTSKLDRALRAADLALLETGVRTVPAGELNDSFRATSSKAGTHWEKSAEVLRRLWDEHADPELFVAVDRHGGRTHYTALLERSFPDAWVEEESVGEEGAAYVLVERSEGARGDRRRRMRVVFAERAEARWFAVALASCLAKYARERSMEAFNAYFAELQPDLSPTAGYTTDGRRWLAEAGEALRAAGVARGVLVRER